MEWLGQNGMARAEWNGSGRMEWRGQNGIAPDFGGDDGDGDDDDQVSACKGTDFCVGPWQSCLDSNTGCQKNVEAPDAPV